MLIVRTTASTGSAAIEDNNNHAATGEWWLLVFCPRFSISHAPEIISPSVAQFHNQFRNEKSAAPMTSNRAKPVVMQETAATISSICHTVGPAAGEFAC